MPKHRGVEGGNECEKVFNELNQAVSGKFREHDPLIQSLAIHYHIAAIHPFLDGNGRMARAGEAFMLRKAGLQEEIFIPVSNFYYEYNAEYLEVLGKTAQNNADLTAFLKFGLRGIKTLCKKAAEEITLHLRKSLFRERMHELFGKLESPRKRVIAKRQILILNFLLDKIVVSMETEEFWKEVGGIYKGLKKPESAFFRDLRKLEELKAVKIEDFTEIKINLLWPEMMSKKEFEEKFNLLPQAKSFGFTKRKNSKTQDG